jgi:regulator of nonsense transcripts 2
MSGDQGADETVPASTPSPLEQLNQYVSERAERIKWKTAMRAANTAADIARLDDNQLKRLDSSIKKVTSFIKRLRLLTEQQRDSLLKEVSQLNLSKYLSEIVSALLEAKLKMNDVSCALHICSQLHRNYADFAVLFMEQWQKTLSLKRGDKVANPSKMRVDLRFFADLVTVGVLPGKEALSLLGNQLTILTAHDHEYANIAIVASFCKHCGDDFAALVPTRIAQLASEHGTTIEANSLWSSERQRAVRTLLVDYFNKISGHVLVEHKEIQKADRQNKKTYQVRKRAETADQSTISKVKLCTQV